MNKKILTLTLLSSVLLSSFVSLISTYAATQTVGTGTGASCTEAALNSAITTAASGDTIAFNCGANATITLSSTVNVGKNLIIAGSASSGLSISGNNAVRVFEVTSGGFTVAFQNFKIMNGRANGTGEAGAGGGIKTNSNTNLTVTNVTFDNNYANGDGGGAIFAGYRSTNTITGSTFTSNETPGNGTSGKSERGGGAVAVKSESSTTISGSTFTANIGTNGGAVNTLLGDLIVTDSTFTNNDATSGGSSGVTHGYGGAIYTDGASASISDAIGGTISIDGSRFEGNKGSGQGGALFLFAYPPDQIILSNSSIIGNEVTVAPNGDSLGGGLRIGNAQTTITNVAFANNIAYSQGGAIWIGETSPTTMDTITLSNNSASNGSTGGLGGGIFVATNSAIGVNNATIINNTAGGEGAGIRAGTNLTLGDSIVSTNVANNSFGNKNNCADGNGFVPSPNGYVSEGGGNFEWPNNTNTFNNGLCTSGMTNNQDPTLTAFVDNGGKIPTHPCSNNAAIGTSGSGGQCGLLSNVNPTISITAPTTGSTYTAPGSFTITANPVDSDGTIAKVEFYIDGVKIGEDTSSSGGWSFNATGVAAGTRSLTVRATDNSGGTTTSSAVSVVVNAAPANNINPTISITAPTAGSTYPAPGSFAITTNPTDSDGTITLVEFFIDGVKVGEDTSATGGWSFNATGLAAGTYSLTVRATDNSGGVAESTVSITVLAQNNNPNNNQTNPNPAISNLIRTGGEYVNNAAGFFMLLTIIPLYLAHKENDQQTAQ